VRRAGIDFDGKHTMRALPSMRGGGLGGSIFTVSLKFTRPDAADTTKPIFGHSVRCGLTPAGDITNQTLLFAFASAWSVAAPAASDDEGAEGAAAVCMSVGSKCGSEISGQQHFGSVITMQWDSARGTLRFLVDGKPHGSDLPGIPRDVHMQWAVEAPWRGTVIEIVECEDDLVTIKD
jgi:hypothetical protein